MEANNEGISIIVQELGTLDGLTAFVILYVAILVFQTLDNFISVYMCGKVEMYMDRDLRDAAFSHLQTLSLRPASQPVFLR